MGSGIPATMSAAAQLPSGSQTFNKVGGWSTVAIGASLPISIAADNALLAVTLLAWLAGRQYRDKLLLAWSHPVYRAALVLFAVLLAGCLYSQSSAADTKSYLLKYLDLALISLLAWAFLCSRRRELGMRMLAAGLAVVLIMSCALKAGLLPPYPWMHGNADSPVVFKLRLTQNILMAFAAFLFAWLHCNAQTRITKTVWAGLCALAIINITMMVEGVTGYILLITLLLLFGWQQGKVRGVGIAIVSACVALTLLATVPGPMQTRLKGVIFEIQTESADRPATTSTGFRLEFYRNTLELIKKHPVAGTGTGSFPAAYADLVKGSGQNLSRNPHNEFMLIAVQTGIFGLGAFLWLLWQQWRYAPLLPTPMERGLAQGLVVTMVIIGMLNSALLDHTEGLLYAWLTALLYAGLPLTKTPEVAQ